MPLRAALGNWMPGFERPVSTVPSLSVTRELSVFSTSRKPR
jgi:hypothetical protein